MIDFKSYASSSTGNLYTVDDGNTKIILDCGLPWRQLQQALDHQTADIAGCLLSHCHFDHSKAAKAVMKGGIDLYTSRETAEVLKLEGHHRLHTVKPSQQFAVGTWEVKSFTVPHDVQNYGYLLENRQGERLLFAIDCRYIPHTFNSLHVVAIGCNYSKDLLLESAADGIIPRQVKNRILSDHMSLDTVCSFLEANDLSRVREIWLLHLSDNNADADAFKKAVQEVSGKVVHVA